MKQVATVIAQRHRRRGLCYIRHHQQAPQVCFPSPSHITRVLTVCRNYRVGVNSEKPKNGVHLSSGAAIFELKWGTIPRIDIKLVL